MSAFENRFVSAEEFEKVVFFAERLDECADVVDLYVILGFVMGPNEAYRTLCVIDQGRVVAFDNGQRRLSFHVITPLDDAADRVYGIDLSDAV